MPGHPYNVITIHLGYGRTRAGRVGNDHGFNAYSLRTSDAPWFGAGAQVQKAGGQYVLATTQLHFNMEDYKFSKTDRQIPRVQTLDAYMHEPPEAKKEKEHK